MKTISLFLFSLLFFISGAHGASPAPAPNVTESVRSTNKIGLAFMRQTIKANSDASGAPQKNTMVSPISAYAAFAMLHGGLRGTTLANLDSFLGISPTHDARFDEQSAALLNTLRLERQAGETPPRPGEDPRKSPILGISNSAWSSLLSSYSTSFINSLRKWHSAESHSLDFRAPGSADTINKWAADNTHGLITKFIQADQLKDLTWLLLNATYLEAYWDDKFDSLPAEQAPRFSLLDGQQVPVEMITNPKRGEWRYLEATEYQAVEVPFYRKGSAHFRDLPANDELSFYVVLPRNSNIFLKWTSEGTIFDSERWNQMVTDFGKPGSEALVTLKMPKFHFAYSQAVTRGTPITHLLGLDFLFQRANFPDFAPLGQGKTVVELIKQDTKIQVDEFGVKAAAVSGIGGYRSSMPALPQKDVIVDRPFLFLITQKQTGTILFVGAVIDPEKAD